MLSALAAPPWCVSSASLGTPAVSTRCHAAGCPSGVPLLATLFRMADRREALLFLLCPGSCRRFIGVRGVGSFFRGVSGSGCRLLPDPFGGCLSLHWQAWRGRGAETWVVEVLRLGYCLPFLGTPHVPLFPSQCLIPAPSPSRGLLWGRSPWSWLPRMLWSLLHSLLQASTAICYYYYYYYIPDCKPQLGELDAKNPKAPAGKTAQ